MKTDILTPFTNAACQTFKLLMDLDALAESVHDTDKASAGQRRVDVAIGITGDITGEVIYRFSADSTLEIVKTMSGMEIAEIDEFVLSALGEIANIISGNAVSGLSQNDIICDILPPETLDDGTLSEDDETMYVFSSNINTSIGDVLIKLQLRTK